MPTLIGSTGFFSTKNASASGNWGLGDGKLALTWIKQYIEAFGGDPNRITIFGESTGGGMTSLLFLDEKVRSKLY